MHSMVSLQLAWKRENIMVGVVFALIAGLVAACQPATSWIGTAVDPAKPAPVLTGINWNGEPFDLSEQVDKVAIVFFGYTMCPDVCPFTLAKIKQVVDQLGDQADDLAVVFVSVDPYRDSVERLARYVPNFNPGFYGLRLDTDQVDALKSDWDVTVQYGQPKDGPGTDSFYYVDHTGTYFIVDRQGQLRLTFPPNSTAADMAQDLSVLLGA